jgi:hypothetical protein
MAFRTNYRLERAERDRIKKAKKEEKLKRQQERAAVSPAAASRENPDENPPVDKQPATTWTLGEAADFGWLRITAVSPGGRTGLVQRMGVSE